MDSSTSYTQAYENDKAVGAAVESLLNPKDIRAVFPITAKVSIPDNSRGFINRDGGWAFTSQGIQRMMDKVTFLGGKIVPCRAVSELCRSDGRVSTVRCADGGVYGADIVVLATGSWSASTFPELGLDTNCVATGCVTYIYCDSVVREMDSKVELPSIRQTMAYMQLSQEEVEAYRSCPVYLDFHTGFYVFPVCIRVVFPLVHFRRY